MVLARPTKEGESDWSTDSADRRLLPWVVVGLLFLLALSLRLWSIGHGLPSIYNPDEAAHFVPRAVDFVLTGDRNPDYLINPPLVTYLFWVVFEVWFGGSAGLAETLSADPSAPYQVARVVIAMIGAVGVVVAFLAGKLMGGVRVGLVAASLTAVAFLPVHWSHFATNDVAAMVAGSVCLLGTAWVLRDGRIPAYLVAGAGLGLATGTKYTAGIMLLPLLTATFFKWREDRRPALIGLLTAGAAAIVTFLLSVPPLLFDFQNSLQDLNRLSLPGEGDPKIGQAQENGFVYYPWVVAWGLGWLASAAAVGGAVWLMMRKRPVALTLIPTPLLYVAFMGGQPAFFGRWLLPVFPIVIVLAAFGVIATADFLTRRLRWPAVPVLVALCILVCLQSLIHVVHMNLALGRDDTRALAAEWMEANIPATERFVNQGILVTPLLDLDPDLEGIQNRWDVVDQRAGDAVGARPQWLDQFESDGACWVSTSGLYSERVLLDAHLVPQAADYYRGLQERGEVVFRASSYREGAEPVPFNFEWVTNLYPFSFERPGGEVVIYRLHGGACA